MSSVIETLLKTRRRLSKNERERLRKYVGKPKNLEVLSSRISELLHDETEQEDPHILEDIFIFGYQICNVVPASLTLSVEAFSMPVVAFVYGFLREPLDKVFEPDAVELVKKRVYISPPEQIARSGRDVASSPAGATLPGNTVRQVVLNGELVHS